MQEVWSQRQLVQTQRNETIHGHDETSRNEARRGRAKIMLHEVYSRKDIMKPSHRVTTIELVVTTVESVRDSKSERTSLLNDTIVRVKL